MFKNLIRAMAVLPSVAALVAAVPTAAGASAAPQHAVGNYLYKSTLRPPCSTTTLECTFTLTAASGSIVFPGASQYCKDPGHRVATAPLEVDCVVSITAELPTRMICRGAEKIYESIEMRYVSSTGRTWEFLGIMTMVNGEGVFDGSAIDTTTGAEAVHVNGVATNLCYTPSDFQPTVYPAWGMTGKIHFTHVDP